MSRLCHTARKFIEDNLSIETNKKSQNKYKKTQFYLILISTDKNVRV